MSSQTSEYLWSVTVRVIDVKVMDGNEQHVNRYMFNLLDIRYDCAETAPNSWSRRNILSRIRLIKK